MKIRQLYTRIWRDNWFCSLDHSSKLLFIFLITNEFIDLTGLYELPDSHICFLTGITTGQLTKCKHELRKKVFFQNGWVGIYNIQLYDSFMGGKLLEAKKKQWEEIPDVIKKAFNKGKTDTLSIGYAYPMDTPNSNSNSNSNSFRKSENLFLVNDEYLEEISKKYKVPLSLVKLSKEEMDNWMAAKGKTYKDYKAGLRNWVLRNAKQQVKDNADNNKKGIDARKL